MNKYEEFFALPDADINTFYVGENDIEWVKGRDGGWNIYGVCDVEGVEDAKLSPFLALSSIQQKQQREGILVKKSEPCSKEEKLCGSDDNNTDQYVVETFLYHTILFFTFLDRSHQVEYKYFLFC